MGAHSTRNPRSRYSAAIPHLPALTRRTMPAKKTTDAIPKTSGIYRILCTPTGQFYVGSAVNLHARWHRHRRSLRNGTHHSVYLQRAWNRHGEANFEFTVLEKAGPDALLSREQAWLDSTGCARRAVGFNIYPQAGSPGDTLARIWRGFYDPAGAPVTLFNLNDFCRRNGLDTSSMIRLSQGRSKLKSYKGWTHKNSVRKRDYVKRYEGFIDPDGRTAATIINLAAFCREHALHKTHMVAVANGRITSHRGWTHQRGRRRQPAKQHAGFIAPGGAFTIITNLRAFCRACDLCAGHMFEVKSGKRPSHKGWTWREPDENHTYQ
jgi:hypothetical protein